MDPVLLSHTASYSETQVLYNTVVNFWLNVKSITESHANNYRIIHEYYNTPQQCTLDIICMTFSFLSLAPLSEENAILCCQTFMIHGS